MDTTINKRTELRNALTLAALLLVIIAGVLAFGAGDAAAMYIAPDAEARWAADFLARSDAFGP